MRGWNGKMLNHYKIYIKTAKKNNIVCNTYKSCNETATIQRKNIHGRNQQTAYILPAIKSSFIECRVDIFFMKRTVNSFHKFLEIGTPYAVFEIPWHKQHASLLIVFYVVCVFFRLYIFFAIYILCAEGDIYTRWHYMFSSSIFRILFQVISLVGKNALMNKYKNCIFFRTRT